MGLSTNTSFPWGSTNQSLLFMNQTKGVLPGCRSAAYPDPSQAAAPWLRALSSTEVHRRTNRQAAKAESQIAPGAAAIAMVVWTAVPLTAAAILVKRSDA
ncbi:hypothetical protein [Oerskovia turbata]